MCLILRQFIHEENGRGIYATYSHIIFLDLILQNPRFHCLQKENPFTSSIQNFIMQYCRFITRVSSNSNITHYVLENGVGLNEPCGLFFNHYPLLQITINLIFNNQNRSLIGYRYASLSVIANEVILAD